MAVRHFNIKHGSCRLRHGNRSIATAKGVVAIRIANRSTNASFASTTVYAPPNTTAAIPFAFLNGADASCVSVSVGSITGSNLEVAVGMADLAVEVADAKVIVAVANMFPSGIASLSPASQFAAINSTATVTLQYAGGHSADDVNVSAGSLSGTTWGIPVSDVPVNATISEKSKVLVEVDNQFAEGIASLSPLSQYVYANSTATVAVQFNGGYSASDAAVSTGSIAGSTWSIPVADSPVSASIYAVQPQPSSVHIGSNDYPFVQIGDLLWTAANLAEPIPNSSGLSVYRWAHNETDNTLGYGMLYDISSIHNNASGRRTSLESLFPSGWRIPTNADFEDLKSHCVSYEDLMRADKGGNDKYGFAGLDTGQASTSGGACFEFTTFQLHTLGSYDTFVVSHSNPSYYLRFHNNGSGRMIAIRLCKNA